MQQRSPSLREGVVVQAQQPRPDIVAIEPTPQPVVVKPVPPRSPVAATGPRTHTQTTGRQAPGRVAAAVPQTAAPVLPRTAALSQPREPSPEAVLKFEAERLLAEREQTAIDILSAYISEEIRKHKFYPRFARRNGITGRVLVKFTVLSNGQVINLQVAEDSGNQLLQNAALRTLRRVGQLPPFPLDIRRSQLTLTKSIVYQIEDN